MYRAENDPDEQLRQWAQEQLKMQNVKLARRRSREQMSMHVITRKRLNEFAKRHPETKNALVQWYRLIKQNDFTTFVELRELFSSADQVGKLTVFNIGGNKVRLIAAVHYNRKKVYIRAVLTHAEYDEGRWKE